MLDESGADALRWYCYVASPAGNPRRFSPRLVGEAQRRFLHTLWNTYSFFVTYANIDGWRPDPDPSPPTVELDRWITSELHALIGRVTTAWTAMTRRRQRGRSICSSIHSPKLVCATQPTPVWSSARSGGAADLGAKESAYRTLYETLTTLANCSRR